MLAYIAIKILDAVADIGVGDERVRSTICRDVFNFHMGNIRRQIMGERVIVPTCSH